MEDAIRKFLIQTKVEVTLGKYPILYERFYINKHYCIENIVNSYNEIIYIINKEYPNYHPFKKDEFLFDEILFSLAYCKFICKNYLGNEQIMKDFICKKLKSTYKGQFDRKTFNESLSEFMIFFYMFTSIFFKSDLYKKFKRIEYETEGANNKRFEYTFVIGDKRINVEVKALDCDPFRRDNLKIRELKHGDRFIKSYFNRPIEELQNIDGEENIRKLSSNYRQLKKNIKRINEKCDRTNLNNINLGFIIINYGTSREEFFSYLFNNKKGILNLNKIDNIDSFILFSMCTVTTLFFDEVYESNHALSILLNENLYNRNLLKKLRLDNYIYHNGKVINKISEIVEEEYQYYKFILKDGLMTIESCYLDEEIIDSKINSLNSEVFNKKRELSTLLKSMK